MYFLSMHSVKLGLISGLGVLEALIIRRLCMCIAIEMSSYDVPL